MKQIFKGKLLWLGILILATIWFVPIYYLVVNTLKTVQEAAISPMGLPSTLDFGNYVDAWVAMRYPNALKNNLIITSLSVLGIVTFGSMAGYTIARKKERAYRIIFLLFLSGIMIPFQTGIVSLYRLMITLNLMNKLIGIVILNVSGGVVMAIFLISGFIATSVPFELEEAAMIDGCGVFRTFFQIVFPLIKPVIATVIILNALSTWNDFMSPLLFLQSRDNSVILLEVFRNVGQFSVDWTSLLPMLILGVAPLMIFYLFMQKYIIKGIGDGALKS